MSAASAVSSSGEGDGGTAAILGRQNTNAIAPEAPDADPIELLEEVAVAPQSLDTRIRTRGAGCPSPTTP